jgi:hypothetical protein
MARDHRKLRVFQDTIARGSAGELSFTLVDAHDPLHGGLGRRVAESGIARLISKTSWNDQLADGRIGRDRHADIYRELRPQDSERLFLPGLREIGRRRIGNSLHTDPGGRVDREHGRDEVGIPRLVGLHVDLVGKADLDRELSAVTRANPYRFLRGREFRARTLRLRDCDACDRTSQQQEDEEETPVRLTRIAVRRVDRLWRRDVRARTRRGSQPERTTTKWRRMSPGRAA